MTFSRYLTTGALAGVLLIASGLSAAAGEARSTTTLNVRTGPGTEFGVVDTLERNEVVNIRECQSSGWCYVEHEGPDGWVSSRYLTAVTTPDRRRDRRDCELRLTLGPDGPKMEMVCPVDDTPSAPAPDTTLNPGEVCFFDGPNYTGRSFCAAPGRKDMLNDRFNDMASSIRIGPDTQVRVCQHPSMTGYCRTVRGNTPQLGARLDNQISSLEISRIGSARVPGRSDPLPPRVLATGPMSLDSSYTGDLDSGRTGTAGDDIWYHAITSARRQLEPLRGARLALGDGRARDFEECRNAAFSSEPIRFRDLRIGDYVCYKTDRGNIGRFQVIDILPDRLDIRYTTWSTN